MLKLELSYRGMLFIGLALLTLWTVREVWPVVVLLVVSLIVFAALLPYVEWLVRHRVPRAAAVLLIFFGILIAIGGAIAVIVPAVIEEFRHLRDNLPEDAREFERFAENFGFNTENWDLPERAAEIDWGSLISGRVAVDYGQRVAYAIFSLFTVIVISAYMLVDTRRLHAFVYRFVPPGKEPEADQILSALGRVVGGYVRGQFITSLIIALFTLVVLLAAGVDNPVAFAVLAGFADIIPLIGAFIATVPPVFAAFQESPTRAAIVLGLLLLYQQFEDRYLVPKIYGSTLNLPPLVVLIAVLIGAELLGITGVLLALPVAAAGRVAFDYFMDRRTAVATPPGTRGEILAPDPPAPEQPPSEEA